MTQLVSDPSREQTLTQKDLERFWGKSTDPYSLWKIISPILSNLHAAYEKGEIPKVHWSLGGSFVVNTYIAPIFRKVHDKDVKLVFVVPPDAKIEMFHRIKAIVEHSLQFLPRDRFHVGKLSYSMQDQDLSFSVCRISNLGESQELPLEITIQLISHPDVRLHVLNLDSAEVTGPDTLAEDELATFALRSKETNKDGSLEPVLTDIRNHIISSAASLEDSFSYSRGEWPRYLFALTDGAVEKDQNTNFYFFLGAQPAGTNLPNQVRHWIERKRGDIPNYECYAILNAWVHCVSPQERADVLLRHLEENPQAFHAWMQKKLYVFHRIESQILQIKKQLHWEGQRRGVLSHYEGYTLLNSLIYSIAPESRSVDLHQNSQTLMAWIKDNPHVLVSLEENFLHLKARIEQCKTNADLLDFVYFMKEVFPTFFTQFLEGEDVRPYFITHLKALLQDPSLDSQIQGTWILFLRKWAQIPLSDSAFLEGIQRFAPLFAEKVVLKKHLNQVHLQCVFEQGEELFHFLIPLFHSEETKKFTSISPKQDLVLSQPKDERLQASPLSHFLSNDTASLSKILQEKKWAQSILEVSSHEDISQFANKLLLSQMVTLEQAAALIPLTNFTDEKEVLATLSFLFNLCKTNSLDDFEKSFFPLFNPLFSRLSLQNQRKVARELIRQICSLYPTSSFSTSLLHKLRELVFSVKIGEDEKKPWQALYISLLFSSPLVQDIERSRFFLTMEKTLSPLDLSGFPKLLPSKQAVSLYLMKQFLWLQAIAPERAFWCLQTALSEEKLLVHLHEFLPVLKKMADLRFLEYAFQRLCQERDPVKALNFLSFKGAFLGYQECIPLYAKLYEQSSSAMKTTIETTCLSVLEELLQTASPIDVMTLYKDCVSMPSVASALEKHPSLSAKDIQEFIRALKPIEKQQYLSACLSRIPNMPLKEARMLCQHLNSLGMQPSDLETLILNLYKQDERFGSVIELDFPHLVEPLLARLNTDQDKLWYYRLAFVLALQGNRYAWERGRDSFVKDFRFLSNKYDKRAVADLITRYVRIASVEERSLLGFACALISPPSESSVAGFHATVTDDFPISLWKSFSWTPNLIQSTWHLMKGKTRQQIEDFVELSMEIIPHSKEYKVLWQEMSPYITGSCGALFVQKVIQQCFEPWEKAKPGALAAYFSFLISCPGFSSHLSRSPSLYEAFLHLSSTYATSAKKDRDYEKNLVALIKLLAESQVVSDSLEERKRIEKRKILLAFSALQELKNRDASYHKIDLRWLVEYAMQSLDASEMRNLVEEHVPYFPELSTHFLQSFIPRLNATTDQEQTLGILQALLSSVSPLSGPLLSTLVNYVLEMNMRYESSDAVCLCSKSLVSMAAKSHQNEVVQELIENIHAKRLEKAIQSGDDRRVLSELAALRPFLCIGDSIPCVSQMIARIGSYCLERFNGDLRFLDIFRSFDFPELSLFVLDLIRMYRMQPQGQYRQLPVDDLAYHVRKIAKLPVERIPYQNLHDLADYFLGMHNAQIYITTSPTLQEGTEATARWERCLADASLSMLSKELIAAFLLRREKEDLEKIEKLIQCIHIDRLEWFNHLSSNSILSDMQMYCTYLENIITHENRFVRMRSSCLVAILEKMKLYSAVHTSYFINRILEVSSHLCLQGPKSFMGFCLSMGSIDIMTSKELVDLVAPHFKLQLAPLLEYAYNCDWEGPGASYFLERLQAVASVVPRSITDAMVEKSLRKACREIDALQSDQQKSIDLSLVIIRMIVNVLKAEPGSKLSRDLKIILMQTLFKLQQISLGTSIVILSEISGSAPLRDLRGEFQQYSQRIQNQGKKKDV